MIITDREWELLIGIDDELDSSIKECCDVVTFLDSLTEEEVEAMRKWIKRNCNYSFNDTDKEEITIVYLVETIRDIIGNVDNILDLVQVFRLVREVM